MSKDMDDVGDREAVAACPECRGTNFRIIADGINGLHASCVECENAIALGFLAEALLQGLGIDVHSEAPPSIN